MPLTTIIRIALDHEGAVWGATASGLFRFINSRWGKIGKEWGFFSEQALGLFVDKQGKLWVNGNTDLYCLSPGGRAFEMRKVAHLWRMGQAPGGTFWIFEFTKGTRAVYDPLAEEYDESKAPLGPELVLRFVDREGGLWMAGVKPDGLRRIAKPEGMARAPNSAGDVIEKFTHQDGLTSNFVNQLLEDAEGNIWVATPDGLDRFRRKNIVQGPFPSPFDSYNPVLVNDAKGIIWEGNGESLATVAGDGMSLGKTLRTGPFGFRGQPQHITCAWRDFDGAIWMGWKGAVTRWTGGRFENVELPDHLAAANWDIQSITGARSGDLWVSIQQHGVYRRRNGAWAQYGNLPELPKTAATILWTDSTDRVWFGYRGNQIALLDGDRLRSFSAPDGLNVGDVLAIGGRGDHVWAAGQFGLALFDGNKFHAIAGEADADFHGIGGAVESSGGDFWLNSTTGLVHLPAAEIAGRLHDPQHKLQYDLFDIHDGLKGTSEQIRPLTTAVEAGDGRIWISTTDGAYWIDPARVYKNPAPPPVTIQAIYEGDRRFSAFEASQLSKLPQNVRIEYTALSLSIPERVRFRYQLEGYDKDWQDVGTRRAAYYSKLPPGHFRFHVIACNNDGVWNQTGAFADIVVPPAFYQTAWFQASCAFAGLALLWGLYRYRLHQIVRDFNLRLEERVNERTRLARGLHDTLLQSFHGVMLRFQVVSNLMPDGKAKQELKKTLDQADRAIAEGRSAVYDLRSSTTVTNDLAASLNAVAKELSDTGSAVFNLSVEGATKELHPIIRDEVYRIAREGLSNAFNHARARHIEVEISYGAQLFRLRIRDDGEGIPAEILDQGRTGHYGLPGMRERAKQIGAELTMRSRPGTGTEIDLSVAGTVAYSASSRRPGHRLFQPKRDAK